ncbi:MAG: AAA family ATPase, partial [Muribaculaceae bacterium]|nr:AAA family ATPase [Muribaculaceae bacterium]
AALSRFLHPETPGEAVFILNGYAGTGKTSLTGTLVGVLEACGRKCMLLAPTGRAAKVFSANADGHPAYTIHRKIYRHQPGAATGDFGQAALIENRMRDTVFIVDEASMIGNGDERGGNLLEDLVTYVYGGDNCRLILIGDTAQLPPVGDDRSPAMKPDVLRSLGLKVTAATLTETARQAADSGILFNATRLRRAMARAIKEGQEETVPTLRAGGDVRVVDGEDLPEALTAAYDRSDGGPADTIVITRSNRRASEYNAAIRANVLYREEEIARGDMLIVARNHYFTKKVEGLEFVANGDIITVERVYGTETRYGLRFADVQLSIPVAGRPDVAFDTKILLETLADPGAGLSQELWNNLYYGVMADEERYGDIPAADRVRCLRTDPYWNALHVKYAYAVTCHKAQGGQWENVFVDLSYIPDEALGLQLYRWLYTAVTRARKNLYLIAPPGALLGKGK